MKYIVFSFDDGLIDFKTNALPILKKYGLTATINVISGYSDLSIKTDYGYLSVSDVKTLYDAGFEIANHTNSHVKYGTYEELLMCNDKINLWCASENILGIAMPKYAKPSESATRFIKEYQPPYITYESQKVISFKNIINRLIWKVISIFNKNESTKLTYSIQRKMYRKGSSKFFRRIEVGENLDPELLYNSLKTIKSKWCISLCFHSVVNDIYSTPYPKGSCTIDKFEKFCELISKDPQIAVITQKEACSR